ncbi:MAG: hypothetical protein V8R08_06720 [Coriobacteriales bacterium]
MASHVFYVDEVSPGVRENNAGSKAREDVSTILHTMGLERIEVAYDQSERKTGNVLTRLTAHASTARDWERVLSVAQSGDTVIVQFPLDHHSLLAKRPFAAARARGVDIVLLIHDLDFIRLSTGNDKTAAGKLRVRAEELSLLELASKIIVHNERMKAEIVRSCGIAPEKIVTLQIFDYLIPNDMPRATAGGPAQPVIIAGNLRKGKADYVYELPRDVEFNLYGAGYEDDRRSNVRYQGTFTPEELVSNLSGSFGLVWDGDSAQTCQGPYGSYLRLNNPHKTSLYLASGLPVIIWDQAALAPFVLEQGVGIVVSSLDELAGALASLTDEEYAQMRDNVQAVSSKLRAGHFTRHAVEQAISRSTP